MEEERKEDENHQKLKNDDLVENQQIADDQSINHEQIDNNINKSNCEQEDSQRDKTQGDEKATDQLETNEQGQEECSPSEAYERLPGILQKTIKKVDKSKDSPEKKHLKIALKASSSKSPQQENYSLLEEIQMRLDQKEQLHAERQNQRFQNGLTGGGVLLWQWFALTEKEIEVKKSKLLAAGKIKPSSDLDAFQTQGYSILLLGQLEKKGKFKGQMLYTDPGGKVEPKETASVVAARELFEETAGLFEIPDRHFDFKTSFRMGGSYILFNILISCEEKDDLPADFRFNMDVLRAAAKQAPKTYLESSHLARIFVDELNQDELFNATQILDIHTAEGETIQIGRRTIAILKSLVRSPNVFDFKKSQILIKDTLNLSRNRTTKESPLVKLFPWLENTIIYLEKIAYEADKEGEKKEVRVEEEEIKDIVEEKEKSENDDEVKGDEGK